MSFATKAKFASPLLFRVFIFTILYSSCTTLQSEKPVPVSAPPVPDSVFLDIEQDENTPSVPLDEEASDRDETKPSPGPRVPASSPPRNTYTDSRPDENGKPLRTDFYAGTLIREKVKDKNGQEIVRLTLQGGATILHEKVILRSPKISIEGGETGKLRGGVYIRDNENDLTITAFRADYVRSKQKVTLTGNPLLVIKQEGGRTARITCDKILHDMGESISYLEGNVRIFHEENTLLADTGRYLNSTRIFLLDKDVMAFSTDTYLTGKQIQYLMNEKRMVVESNVGMYSRATDPEEKKEAPATVQTFPTLEEYARTGGRAYLNRAKPGPEGQDSKKEKKLSILSADRLIYNLKQENRQAEFEVVGNVMLTRETFLLKSPYIHSTGKEMQFIVADRGVEIEDKEGGFNAKGKKLSYDRTEQIMRLEEEVLMEFRDEDTGEVNGTMTAAVIISELDKKITRARGNILIRNEEFEARAETARYDNEVGIVILEGNPELSRGGSTVQSERILIYPDKGRVLLLNGIRGSFGNR